MGEYKYKELTHDIINAAHTVHNALGYGFLEKIYHNSLFIELNALLKTCHFDRSEQSERSGEICFSIDFSTSASTRPSLEMTEPEAFNKARAKEERLSGKI